MNWLVWLALSPAFIFSEYRVFELRIVNTRTQQSRVVLTTLDWLQYPGYHHLSRDEKIEVMDHWMCWKRNDGLRPLCRRPGTADTLKSESEEPES